MLFGILFVSIVQFFILIALVGVGLMLRDDVRTLQKQVITMTAAYDDLKAAVAEQTSLDKSVLTLVNGFADKLSNLPAGTSDADLKALADELRAGAQPLAAAVTANTPAAASTAPAAS